MAGWGNASISCSLPHSLKISIETNSTLVLSSPYVRLICLGLSSRFYAQHFKVFLLLSPPPNCSRKMTKQNLRSKDAQRVLALSRDMVPVRCGPAQGIAHCQSCWSSRSGAWRAAAPSGVCSSSAGVCAPHPLCCHRYGKKVLNSPPQPQILSDHSSLGHEPMLSMVTASCCLPGLCLPPHVS